jgi:hypothetical protein
MSEAEKKIYCKKPESLIAQGAGIKKRRTVYYNLSPAKAHVIY